MVSVTYLSYVFADTIASGGGGLILGGPITGGGNKICNIATPTANQDAATKLYVDNCAGGGAGIWTDATNPFIIPCNSCNICVACVCVGVKICACSMYAFANISAGGSVGASTCVFSDKGCLTCTYVSELLKIPVGTNCY